MQGVDVWLNTPRRPWEASGTSGMKVLVNGGINLSELDGWWAEAYTPEVGWALGDGKEHGDDPAWDAIEADALYDLLEHEVIPEFYTPRRARYSHGLGRADARKHGAVDAAVFRQPRGARIHRATLPAGCGRLPRACGRKGALGAHMVELAPHSRRSLARAALRRNEGRRAIANSTYSRCRSISAISTRMR